MSRLSVPLKGRASGPSGHFAQPRLIGYSGPPTGRPALHHRESAYSFPSRPSPLSLLLPLLLLFVVFLSISMLCSCSFSLSLSVFFRLVSRRSLDSSNLLRASCDRRRFHQLSLAVNQVERDPPDIAKLRHETRLAETSQTVESICEIRGRCCREIR